MNLFSPLKNRRWKLTLGVITLVMGVMLWFAPTIVVRSPLWPRILAHATKDMDVVVQTETVSVGWLSPIRVHGLVIQDLAGANILTCESVEVQKNLLSLLREQSDLGTILVEAPHLKVVFDEASSNREGLIAPL